MVSHLGNVQRAVRTNLDAKGVANIDCQCVSGVAVVLWRACSGNRIDDELRAEQVARSRTRGSRSEQARFMATSSGACCKNLKQSDCTLGREGPDAAMVAHPECPSLALAAKSPEQLALGARLPLAALETAHLVHA